MSTTVLVVDDLDTNIKLLEAKLLREYYLVLIASSGQEAIDILANHDVDVILLDGMMPGMDGFETCRKIKANPATTHIPVVMVTALSDIEDRVKGLEAGADEFLTKPVDDIALFARVNSLSRTKAVIDALKIRNETNALLGAKTVDLIDSFDQSKIFVIDDDVVQVKNINKILSKITSNIAVCSDLSTFDEVVQNIEADLFIISCQIEGNDPLRLAIKLRTVEQLRASSIMFLAEDENMKMVIKGMDLGVNDYFIYPVDENELIARAKTQLRRKKYQDGLRNELEESVNLSIRDGLTGLYNRRYFDIHIEQLLSKNSDSGVNLCLVMMDIDHFKEVNDLYGHQVGDIVLKSVTDILSQNTRAIDLLARYGGEEFALLLSNISLEEATIIADRLRMNVEQLQIKIPDSSEVVVKTISMGIAEYKEKESVAQFIDRADKALYAAKASGRNKVMIG
jgi:two-component system cell cycle response regulator